MAGTTTAFCTSAKKELPQAAHCFNATVTPTGNTTNGSVTIASVSALTAVSGGSSITGTGIPASNFVADMPTTASITLAIAATATNTGTTLTITGDIFKTALVKASPTGTYDATTTNYSNLTGNSDEVSGTGYTAGGQALTNNITPATSGTTAFWSWTNNPSWTSATFSAIGMIIYNTAHRLEGVANRSISVHDFGGTQTVSAGTFTVILPTNNNSSAILRVT